ncbi:MAG TPA: hypothetical protein VG122_19745 [Gemmata sp.]|jgi:hypothetical protein|nr:hypothetical protein [Gemmata sp.]
MPPTHRIRLRIEERNPDTCRYREPREPVGTSRLIPLLRLATLAQVAHQTGGQSPRATRALIDTGAWISAIETTTWGEYDRAGLIEPLPLTDATNQAPALIGGCSSTYRLGRVWLKLVDLLPTHVNWLPAVPVIAPLLENPECHLPAPILLGLHRGVLDGRKLTREPTPPPPGPIPPNHNSDCGEWYGQQWYLETA